MCEVGDEDGGLVHGEHGAAHGGHVISEGANKAAVVLSPHQACTVTSGGCQQCYGWDIYLVISLTTPESSFLFTRSSIIMAS